MFEKLTASACLLLLTLGMGCARAARNDASAADSAAAAGFRALIAATPDAAAYCLSLGNPAHQRDPTVGAPQSRNLGVPLRTLLEGRQEKSAKPLLLDGECEHGRPTGTASLKISHLLVLADSTVHVTATAMSSEERLAYACRVRRVGVGAWAPAAACEVTGYID